MRILVENSGYHLLNLGDVAMLQAGVERLSAHLPAAQIEVVTTAPARLARFCPQARPVLPDAQQKWRNAKTTRLPLSRLPAGWRDRCVLQGELLKMKDPERAWHNVRRAQAWSVSQDDGWKTWREFIQRFDAVVALGGGYLNDTFRLHLINVMLSLRLAQSLGKPTAWFGQGLGPLRDPALSAIVARALQAAEIVSLREEIAARQFTDAHNLDFSQFRVCGDDAFALLSQFQLTEESKAPLIGVNLRPASYAELDTNAMRTLRDVLLHFVQMEKGYVLPLAVSLPPSDDDAGSVRELFSSALLAETENVDSPTQLYTQVNRCRLVITASYHAAVFALAAGVPTIGLVASAYYEQKFSGLNAFFPHLLTPIQMNDEIFLSRLQTTINRLFNLSPAEKNTGRTTAQDLATRVDEAYKTFCHSLAA